MHYISTRGGALEASFTDVLLAALARDGGLFVPKAWPRFTPAEIAAFKGKPYADVAFAVIQPFVGGAIPDADLARMIREAYATFDAAEVAPLRKLRDGEYFLELFHGPTLAFKDVAMQLLARLMDHALAAKNDRVTIVGATSGDTGGAAVEAFRGRDRADLVILFPNGRVSDVQRLMMTTPTEPNIHAVAIEGTFDDCQAIVKALFNDHGFRDRMKLSGVNSINFARIVAQIVYYFTAAAALGAPEQKISFVVPTGNFGDIFAGYVAKQMGLPIERLVIATNVNDILARTLATGRYEIRGVVATDSPAMDIQVSSNFERLLFDAYGRDADAVRKIMSELSSGGFAIAPEPLAAIRAVFDAGRADEAETLATIRAVHQESGYLLDPHSAVGVAVARKHKVKPPYVMLGTAHPAKFPDAVAKAAGVRPALPARLSDLMSRKERFDVLPADVQAVARYVTERSRVGEGTSA
ncbi:MAG TPA: threonine synthase [Xanthobacteraceae bacterium]|nr:threonine synthase [Xanthobacteraceae bacterium]